MRKKKKYLPVEHGTLGNTTSSLSHVLSVGLHFLISFPLLIVTVKVNIVKCGKAVPKSRCSI